MDGDVRESWQEQDVRPAKAAEMQNWPPNSKTLESDSPSESTVFKGNVSCKVQSTPLEAQSHRSGLRMTGDTPIRPEIDKMHVEEASAAWSEQSGRQTATLAVPWVHETEPACGSSSASSSLNVAFIDSQGPGLNVDLDWEACCDDPDGGESEREDVQRFRRGMGLQLDDNTAGCGHQDGWFEGLVADGINGGLNDGLEGRGEGKGMPEGGCLERAGHKSVDIKDADWWRDVPIDLSDWPDSQRYACHEKYEVLERIGEGTFGAVYKAKRKEDGMIVALKKCFKRRLVMGQVENLMREVHALEQVDHPHVVSKVGFGLMSGLLFGILGRMYHGASPLGFVKRSTRS